MGAGGFYSATDGPSKAGRWCPGDQDLPQPSIPVFGIREARGAAVALGLPPASLPGLNLWETFLAPPRKAQPLDRSVRAAGFGRRKVGEAWRSQGEGGGRRAEGGGFRGGSGKWQASYPPQSVELERAGERGGASATKLLGLRGVRIHLFPSPRKPHQAAASLFPRFSFSLKSTPLSTPAF